MTEENRSRAIQAAMVYLGQSDRTMSQVREYLKKKEFQDEEIRSAIDRLLEYGFVNDEAYARRFVLTHPSSGKLLLRQKLRQKGVDKETAEEVLSSISEDEQVNQALDMLRRKLRGDRNKDTIRRAMQSVLRRGFPYPIVRTAVARYDQEAAEELYDE